jgi:hypothetical protein
MAKLAIKTGNSIGGMVRQGLELLLLTVEFFFHSFAIADILNANSVIEDLNGWVCARSCFDRNGPNCIIFPTMEELQGLHLGDRYS